MCDKCKSLFCYRAKFCFSYCYRSRTILDDFREAYYWLRQNTDEKARVMSWWDYGYQIAGMGNRTTLVDNNTWNNSHIALVSRKTSPRACFQCFWFKLTMTNSLTCMLFWIIWNQERLIFSVYPSSRTFK